MYLAVHDSESPLKPVSYKDPDLHSSEIDALFTGAWHVIGLASRVSRDGDYLAGEIAGIPVVVKNFSGTRVALRNVCSHRHSQLVEPGCGRSERLKCPFHGWEYGADGRTRRIPEPRNFPHLDREKFRLAVYSVDVCGDLLFVKISPDGPTLKEWLGEMFERLETWCQPGKWQLSAQRSIPYPANWKIPVETSLESYHIPEVHPKTFGKDPGETVTSHTIGSRVTSFSTESEPVRLPEKLLNYTERFVLAFHGVSPSGRYEHYHIFPNLLVSHTDSMTLIHSVIPATAESSVGHVWQFRRCSSGRNPVVRALSWWWGKVMAILAQRVLNEDLSIYSKVQAGVSCALQSALLGRCEERILAFHEYISRQMNERDVVS
jgi:choline monooxygenase